MYARGLAVQLPAKVWKASICYRFDESCFQLTSRRSRSQRPRYVAALTHRLGAQVTVLHVSHAHATYADGSDVSLPPAYALDLAWCQLQESQAAEKMREFVCSSMRDVVVVPRLLTGDPATTIINQANDLNADLIVMTTHGSGVLRRMLLGSVTAKSSTTPIVPSHDPPCGTASPNTGRVPAHPLCGRCGHATAACSPLGMDFSQ